jgi:hypothetical protein
MSELTLSQRVEEAISKVNKLVPEITLERVEKLKSLQERMINATTQKQGSLPDGVYKGSLNSEYLKTLREGLTVYKDLILPSMMRDEVTKLRSIASMIETANKNDDISKDSGDLVTRVISPLEPL